MIEKDKAINEKSKEIRKIQQHNTIQTQNLNDQITEKSKALMQSKQDVKAALMANLITQDLQKQVEEEKSRSNYYYKNQQNLQIQL